MARFVREAYEELIKQVQWANEEDKAEILEKVKLIESIINDEMFVVTCSICSFFKLRLIKIYNGYHPSMYNDELLNEYYKVCSTFCLL